jgi:hypothetical protein
LSLLLIQHNIFDLLLEIFSDIVSSLNQMD